MCVSVLKVFTGCTDVSERTHDAWTRERMMFALSLLSRSFSSHSNAFHSLLCFAIFTRERRERERESFFPLLLLLSSSLSSSSSFHFYLGKLFFIISYCLFWVFLFGASTCVLYELLKK